MEDKFGLWFNFTFFAIFRFSSRCLGCYLNNCNTCILRHGQKLYSPSLLLYRLYFEWTMNRHDLNCSWRFFLLFLILPNHTMVEACLIIISLCRKNELIILNTYLINIRYRYLNHSFQIKFAFFNRFRKISL